MIHTAIRSSRVDDSSLLDAHYALVRSFDVSFDFWEYTGVWTRAGNFNNRADIEPSAELAALLDKVPESDPFVSETALGQRILAIPMRFGKTRVVATGFVDGITEALLVNFANLFISEQKQREDLQQAHYENHAFLRQVTNDFEELTFLRSMAELLEVSDLSFDFHAMVENVLPTLRPLCDAESMVLIEAGPVVVEAGPAVESAQIEIPVLGPKLWCGTTSIDDARCTALVERYKYPSIRQPVVRNRFQDTPEGRAFPDINAFILVPIVKGEETIGWLLALNRDNDRNIMAEELPWEVSYLEFGTHEATLMSSSAAILATYARNVDLFREREELLVSVVRALVSAIEAKDEYTRGHSERVALYAQRLAEELGCDEDYCQRLYLTGLLHDVGKIGVRDAVLSKPGPLTDDEFEEIKQHPDKGWAILNDLDALGYVLPGVLHHHEQVNGKGYPDQLSSDGIPVDGRILAVADAYDAMTSDRSYRPGMPHEKAESILRAGAGSQWDAEMIDAFLRVMPDILEIKQTYQPRANRTRKPTSVEREHVESL